MQSIGYVFFLPLIIFLTPFFPLLNRPSMDVAIPIHHKGRSYWPPVFFDSQTNKLDSPSLAAFGECVLSHFGSQDNHIHENGGGKEERRAATFDTYKDTCRSAVWNTDWIDNQTWRLRDKYYKCGDGAFTSLSHEVCSSSYIFVHLVLLSVPSFYPYTLFIFS